MNERVMQLIVRVAGLIESASDSSIAPDKRIGWQMEIGDALSSLDESDRAVFAEFVGGLAHSEVWRDWVITDAEDAFWRDWYRTFPSNFGLTESDPPDIANPS